MDLRRFPAARRLDEDELLSLQWYQPYNFTDDIVSGEAPQWWIKGLDRTIVKRSQFPKHFKKFWEISNRTARMYEDWGRALCDLPKVNLNRASIFEGQTRVEFLLSISRLKASQQQGEGFTT